jgi:pre-mRNA-splicing factor 38A
MSKPTFDRADASALLDDRGYSGALIRGQNPALLFEKGVRERITESYYWKEQCFGLNAATLCDRAVELKFIGGTSGITGRPTPFLCLAFKMLQLVPEKGIVLEMLNFRGDEDDEEDVDAKREAEEEEDHKLENGSANADGKRDLNAEGKLGSFKYLRCLAAFYIRLAWEPVEIYNTLEPLLTDYRKIKRRLKENFSLTHVDQFVDDLLTKERICATSLWKLPSRTHLEDLDLLEPRESPLGDEIDMLDEEDEKMKEREGSVGSDRSARSYRSRSYDSRSRSRSRSRSYDSRRSRSRSRSYDSRDRRRSRSPGEMSHGRRSRSRTRSRSRSRERH